MEKSEILEAIQKLPVEERIRLREDIINNLSTEERKYIFNDIINKIQKKFPDSYFNLILENNNFDLDEAIYDTMFSIKHKLKDEELCGEHYDFLKSQLNELKNIYIDED